MLPFEEQDEGQAEQPTEEPAKQQAEEQAEQQADQQAEQPANDMDPYDVALSAWTQMQQIESDLGEWFQVELVLPDGHESNE